MNKKFIFIFSFLFIILISNVLAASNLSFISDISNQSLGNKGTFSFNLKDYATGTYDTINVRLHQTGNDGKKYSVVRSFNSLATSCITQDVEICITPYSNDFYVQITSLNKNIQNDTINVYITNLSNIPAGVEPYGVGSEWALKTFYVSTNSSSYQNLSSSTSFIGVLTGVFVNVFPNEDTMNTSQKFGFVFITLLLVDMVLLFLFWKIENTSIKLVSTLLVVIDIALILYFIAIGYIPLALLVVIALILVLLAYFKIKGNTQ